MFENIHEFTGDPIFSGPAIYNLSVSASPFSLMASRSGAASGDAPLFNTDGQRLIFKVKTRLSPTTRLLMVITVFLTMALATC